jgi:GT2 family glycosyltransferase
MAKLSILTLNWNGADKLRNLYPTLINSLSGIDFEWFVKDNNSNDDSVDYLNSLNNDKIKVLPYKDNRQNFSAGVNYLFNAATPSDNDLVMLLNNDVIFNDTTSISSMLEIINKDPNVGVVGGRLLYTGTNKLQHAGVVFDTTYKTPMHFRASQVSDANAEKNRVFQVVTGAVLITRAHLFKRANIKNPSGINGMDEHYHWAFDDVDLCLSIKYDMGKKIVYCGKTNIFHEESATLKKNPANKMFLPHNLNYLFNKWRGRYIIDRDIYARNPNCGLYQG